jgi:hypothetical protein
MRPEPDSILGFVTGPTVNIWFMHSVFNLFKSDQDNRFAADWLLVFGPYIHQNRDRLAAQFLEEDRDWLLSVDNDMVFTPSDVFDLFKAAEQHGPGVYAAPYMIENSTMTCGPWDDTVPQVYHPMYQLPEAVTRVGVVGCGFTLIHRDVLEAVGEHPFAALFPDAGEDISFCWRAREVGYVPWLVPSANPGHFKQVALYPHEQVKNMIGDEINLEQIDPTQRQEVTNAPS